MPDLGHSYTDDDRCINCDCRPWGKWAKLPCGEGWDQEVHRGDPVAEANAFFYGFLAYAMAKSEAERWKSNETH